METQLEYVLRKLKDERINVPAVAKEVGTSKQNLYNLIKSGDGKASLIEKLADNFKKIAE
jgi:hypothetical protein